MIVIMSENYKNIKQLYIYIYIIIIIILCAGGAVVAICQVSVPLQVNHDSLIKQQKKKI